MMGIGQILSTVCYDIFLVLAFMAAAPRIFYKMLVYGKYKKFLKIRFGLKKPKCAGDTPLIWFHGASVGEVSLLQPVVNRFKQQYPNWRYIITACSEAGVLTADRLYSHLGIVSFVLPFDISFIIKPLVKKLKPKFVIFSEGDCWMNFVCEAKKQGATTIVINGKLSEHSSKLFSFFKKIGRNYFSCIDYFLLQDEQYRQRFLQLGVSEPRLFVTGNIKTYKEEVEEQSRREELRNQMQLDNNALLIVLGSLHIKDFVAWIPVLHQISNIKILLVPRHLEKVQEFAHLCSKEGWSYSLWSQQTSFINKNLIIVDVMGLLKLLYQAGDLAFVGGTFDPKVGGHNLLEPLQAKVPLIFGPYIQSQSELAMRLIGNKAGYCVPDSLQMRSTVEQLLLNHSLRKESIDRGTIFLEKEKSAFTITWQTLLKIVA